MFFLQILVCLVCGALFGCVMYSLAPPLRRLHNLASCVAIGALANIILFLRKSLLLAIHSIGCSYCGQRVHGYYVLWLYRGENCAF